MISRWNRIEKKVFNISFVLNGEKCFFFLQKIKIDRTLAEKGVFMRIRDFLPFFCIPILCRAEENLPPSPVESLLSGTDKLPSYEATFLKMLLTLAGLLALVFLTVWLLRKLSGGRFGGSGSQKKIAILERKPLSPKTVLYLIELEGKKILIAESQLEVTALSRASEEELYT